MSQITTIVFDFGNVLFDLDFPACYARFQSLIGKNWPDNNVPKRIQEVNEELERGEISEETFIWNFQQLNPAIHPKQVIDTWNSLLVEMPKHRFSFLEELGKNYKLALLSNINSIHEKYIESYFEDTYKLTDFTTRYFDAYFFSHHIGMRKPEVRIYDYVQKELGCSASEILFIDDNQENINAALKKGWQAHLHDPATDIVFKCLEYLRI